jgi:hypothetical protein
MFNIFCKHVVLLAGGPPAIQAKDCWQKGAKMEAKEIEGTVDPMTHCESDQKSSNNAKGTGKFLVYD